MNFLKLIRFQNLLMVLLIMVLTKYALIETILPKTYLSDFEFVIFVISVLFITAGGYIINDIYDVDIDLINKPHKTFVGVSISKPTAWKWYIALTSIGLALAVYLCIRKHLPDHILYYVLGIACLYFYSSYFQKKVLIGNVIIAFICGALIYLTYSFDFRVDHKEILETQTDKSVTNIALRVTFVKFYIVFSFFGTLIREMIKDIEDIDGDYKAGCQTLPILFGRKRTRNMVIFLSLLFLLALIFCTTLIGAMNYDLLASIFGGIVLLSIFFLYKLWWATTKKQFHQASSILKLILFFGILSMILFTFV